MNNEPVAFWNKDFDLWEENAIQTYKADGWNIPLYTHPHPDNLGLALSIIDQQKLEIEALKAKTLTDEEIESCWDFYTYCPKWAIDFARKILRKLQEK